MLKIYKPTTPSRRKASVIKTDKLSKKEPEKSLITIRKKKTGRSFGRVTVRHRGGGEKKFYRSVDFKQDKFDIPGIVKALEYDPNRSAWLALVYYPDGEKRYILAPKGLEVNDQTISSQNKIEAKIGNRMPIKYIPSDFSIYNLELKLGRGGKIVRSAGTTATLMACEKGFAQVKLSSGEIRLIPENCLASIGQVSNPEWRQIRWGKAGRLRHRGIRPSVRGKAMNPVDHPHGGGEGHSPTGLVHPKTPWGKPALGVKTRKKRKWSNRFIIKRRK